MTNPLQLKDLIELALRGNPVVDQSQALVAQARSLRRRAETAAAPLAGWLRRSTEDPTQSAPRFTANLERPDTERRAAISAATHRLAQASFSARLQEERVKSDVGLSYFDLLCAMRARELLEQELLPRAREVDASVERLRRLGIRDRLDLIESAGEIQNQERAAQEADAAISRLRCQLAALARLENLPAEVDGSLTLEPPTATAPLEVLWKQVRSRSPEIRITQLEVARARAAGRAAQAHELGRDITSAEPVGLPRSIGDAARSVRGATQAEAAAKFFEVQRVEMTLRYRLAAVIERRDRARAFLLGLPVLLPAASESFESIHLRYAQERSADPPTFSAVAAAQRRLTRLRLEELDARRDLWQAHVQFDNFLACGALSPPRGGGGGLAEGLGEPPPQMAAFQASKLV